MDIIKKAAFCCLLSSLSYPVFAGKDSVDSQPMRVNPASPQPDDEVSLSTQPHYKLNLPVDAAITLPATAWTIFAFPKIYDKPEIDSATLASLSKDNIPAFDRW